MDHLAPGPVPIEVCYAELRFEVTSAIFKATSEGYVNNSFIAFSKQTLVKNQPYGRPNSARPSRKKNYGKACSPKMACTRIVAPSYQRYSRSIDPPEELEK